MSIAQKYFIFFIVALQFSSCKDQDEQGDWIKGKDEAQIKTVEKHFRGLDLAMMETGYRYQELFWAGQDQNWDYATYQLQKIKLAMELALQRRPARAKSAEIFITETLPAMSQAVETRDTGIFNKQFNLLTSQCNKCHETEKVAFFNVRPPVSRHTLIMK